MTQRHDEDAAGATYAFYLDGWYTCLEDAEDMAEYLRSLTGVLGAEALCRPGEELWAVLYLSNRSHFENHEAEAWKDFGRRSR